MLSCKPLSNHPSPLLGESIGKWIGRLAIENSIPYNILLSHIGTYARKWGFLPALSGLTNIPVDVIKLMKDEIQDRFWENPMGCPIKNCAYHSSDLNGHLARMHGFGSVYSCSSDLEIPSTTPLIRTSHQSNNKYFTHAVWDEIKNYPHSLQNDFLELKAATQYFITEGQNPPFIAQHLLPDSFLKTFCYCLGEQQNLSRSFTRAGGLMGDFGFDWSLYQINRYFQEKNRPPRESAYPFCSIKYCCKKGAFNKWGIYNWISLLQKALGRNLYYKGISFNFNFKTKEGLTRACEYLRQFKLKNNRIPLVTDSGVKLILKSVQRGIWGKFGIRNRHDLFYHVFGEEYDSYHVWEGLDGLKKARATLKSYYEQHGCVPKHDMKGYQGVHGVIRRGLWKNYGINSWEELIKDIFSPQNAECECLKNVVLLN